MRIAVLQSACLGFCRPSLSGFEPKGKGAESGAAAGTGTGSSNARGRLCYCAQCPDVWPQMI